MRRILLVGIVVGLFLSLLALWGGVLIGELSVLNPASWKRVPLNQNAIRKGDGFSYLVYPVYTLCDSHLKPSTCEILENGLPLPGTANALHDDIRRVGKGSYSFWGSYIYFSTSDNTDPRTNGRRYEVIIPPLLLSDIEKYILFGLTILLMVGLQRFIHHNGLSFSLPRKITDLGEKIPVWLVGLLPIVVYVLILISPIPLKILKNTGAFYLLGSTVLLFFTLGKPEKKWLFISLTVILIVIGISITSLWSLARSHYNAVGGLLPWSDARGYYLDALSISAGDKVRYSVDVNRVLHTAPLAVLLGLTRSNLQAVIALLGFFWGIAVLFLAKELENTFGYGSGGIGAFLCLAFYYDYVSGTLLSENTGFILGGLGTAVLLNGTRKGELIRVALGLFLITLALNARNGAFLVLPLLIVWGSVYFSSGFSPRNLIILIVTVLAAFGINSFYRWFLANSTDIPNYAGLMLPFLVWGLVTRHSPTDAFLMFPGISNKSLGEILIPEIVKAVQAEPWSALQGVISPFGYILGLDSPLILGFMRYINGISLFSRICYLLLLLGIVVCMFRFRRSTNSLLLFSFIGIFISAPFTNYVGFRGQASTMPLAFSLIAAGAAFIVEKVTKYSSSHTYKDAHAQTDIDRGTTLITTWIIVWITILPFFVNIIKPEKFVANGKCDNGTPVAVAPLLGSYIRIEKGIAGSPLKVPNVDREIFKKTNPAHDAHAGPVFGQELVGLVGGTRISVFPLGYLIIRKLLPIDVRFPATLCVTGFRDIPDLYVAAKSINNVQSGYWARQIVFWLLFGIILAASTLLVNFFLKKRKIE